jgi:hypothetical protein
MPPLTSDWAIVPQAEMVSFPTLPLILENSRAELMVSSSSPLPP